VEEPAFDDDAALYGQFMTEVYGAQRALNAIRKKAEIEIADMIMNASTWTGASLTTAVSNEWDDYSAATPIDNIEAAVQAIYDGVGLWPNTLVIGRKVFRNLRNCDAILARISASGAGDKIKASDITPMMLAQVFDLDNVLIGGGTKNTANEGQDAVLAPIWSDEYAMVCKVPTSGDIREPGIGRTFHWAGDGTDANGTLESYHEVQIRAEIIRARHWIDPEILYVGAGHLLSNITTAE
jgi:hypothetical protein